jgi:hypothetical protein
MTGVPVDIAFLWRSPGSGIEEENTIKQIFWIMEFSRPFENCHPFWLITYFEWRNLVGYSRIVTLSESSDQRISSTWQPDQKYITNVPALKESVPNSSDKHSREGFSFINIFLRSSKSGAYWFPEKRGEWSDGPETRRKPGVNFSPALSQQWVANEDHPVKPRWRHALLSYVFTDRHLVNQFTRSRTDCDSPIGCDCILF